MTTHFDIFIIGTGTGGSYAARIAAQAGKKVAIVDDQPYGGTCALRGCNPKKSMVNCVELVEWYNRMRDVVLEESNPAKIDFSKLAKFKTGFVQNVTKYRESAYEDLGITMLHGVAEFQDEQTIKVDNQVFTAEKFLIASGSTPRELHFDGAQHIKDSDYFLDMQQMPKRVVFLGAGYISMEFAGIAARSGAQVTILHRSKRILRQFDEDIVKVIQEATEEAGIKIQLCGPVDKIVQIQSGDSYIIRTKFGKEYPADLIINGTGRVPKVSTLNLEAAKVDYSEKGITVNEFMQTTNQNIYSSGDVANSGTPQLAPVAKKEGETAIQNMLKGNSVKFELGVNPNAVFTEPRLATVGLTERESKEQGLNFRVNFEKTGGWASSRYVGEKHSAYKIIIDEDTDQIIGAHICGHGAEEVINVIAMAMHTKMTATELKNMTLAYPTMSSSMKDML